MSSSAEVKWELLVLVVLVSSDCSHCICISSIVTRITTITLPVSRETEEDERTPDVGFIRMIL